MPVDVVPIELPVLVCPGLPRDLSKPTDVQVVYPDTTTDMVKILRARGYRVAFVDPDAAKTLVGHKAVDVWLPILEFGSALIATAGGEVLATLILDYFKARHSSTPVAHISWHVTMPDGQSEAFEYDGPSDQAAESARVFEKRLGNRLWRPNDGQG